MLTFLKKWREKRKLRKAFADDLKTLRVLDAFGELEGDFETKVMELESAYLKRGLTEEDIKKVQQRRGPIRIE